jgi:hypothetical protein
MLVKINSIGLQHQFEFILERMAAMMLFLRSNVVPHSFNLRLANGEGGEPRLPRESSARLPLRPARRTRFQFTHEF